MAEEIKILLVEDDFNLGFVIQDNLTLKGYTVHLSRDGKEGLNSSIRTNMTCVFLMLCYLKKTGSH